MKKSLIITTINSPNKVLKDIAKQAFANNIQLIVIGDKKTPEDFKIDNCIYLSLQQQILFNNEFGSMLPVNHYSRKNIGYLYAMAQSPNMIQETDDDNIPYESFWFLPEEAKLSYNSKKDVWYNVYSHFLNTDTIVWPRGYPLEQIRQNNSLALEAGVKLKSLIFQGLANENPDVDAIYRLTNTLPINFQEKETIQLGSKVWCPFNSQNTIFLKEAFPLLYLPSTCSFRMTDIWRSFIAQRCLWEMGGGVSFHSATVYQERNEHRLLRDFEDEIPGYLGNEKIKELLTNADLSKGDIYSKLQICYEILTENNYFEKKELQILNQWIISCKKL